MAGRFPVLTCQVQHENGICGNEMPYARNKNRKICRKCERDRKRTVRRNSMKNHRKDLVEKNG